MVGVEGGFYGEILVFDMKQGQQVSFKMIVLKILIFLQFWAGKNFSRVKFQWGVQILAMPDGIRYGADL